MDPLSLPVVSDYEWEYRSDINQRMRVPDKLSVGSSLSELAVNESKEKDVLPSDTNIKPYKLIESTPGYSPDLINNDPQFNDPSDIQVVASASASALATVRIGGRSRGGQNEEVVDLEVVKTSAIRISRLESHISRISNRIHVLEQQQTVLGLTVALYVGVKVIRWIVRLILP